MNDFSKLEEKINIKFENKNLLTQAFCHRSYLNENPSFHLNNNERLEFLGDAVIELVVTEYLYNKYSDKPEGELTSLRASLVNAKMLAKTAQDLDFSDYLLLSKGESKENGKARQYILADVFEAFVGSLYLDKGLKVCRKFIEKHLIKELAQIIEQGLYLGAKSLFQEKAQEKTKITPIYKVLKEWGPDHSKEFLIGVFLEDELIAEGQGLSKQEAEEQAARKALELKNW